MNLRKTVLSLLAAGTLLMGGAGIANAQTTTSTTGASVTISGTGDAFNAYFCSGNVAFGSHALSSHDPSKKVEASLSICYHDNAAHRDVFRAYMSATNFEEGNGTSISATNLSPKFMSNVEQGQWRAIPGVGSIGSIGAMTGAADYSAGGQVTSWPGLAWTGGNLATAQYVAYGWSGIGTGGVQYLTADNSGYGGNPDGVYNWYLENGSIQRMSLELTIPATTANGTYGSTLTLNVYVGTAP